MSSKEQVIEGILAAFEAVRQERPLVHMIGSVVTSALCADAISAVGGRPLMAQAAEEMEEITASADGLCVNLGQPSREKYRACESAMRTAAACGHAVVLDPVGAGASELRRSATAKLTALPWSGILKGNSSEIHTVLTGHLAHSGVDSVGSFSHEEEAERFLRQAAREGRRLVIAETGAVDKIRWIERECGKVREIRLGHGTERQVLLVGTGCAAGAVMGTLAAAERKAAGAAGEPERAMDCTRLAVLAAAAVSMVSFAGEAQGDCGYGAYKAGVLDVLSRPDPEKYREWLIENLDVM